MPTDYRPEAAEALGVFLFMVAGGLAVAGGIGILGVAVAFGFAIMVLIYAVGHVSGAHFNPAITIAFAATGHFPWRRVPSYVGAQLAGALAATLALRAFGAGDVLLLRPSEPLPIVLAAETVATFLLAFVIVAVATDRRAAPGVSGLAIGSAVLVGILGFAQLSGASMNPARALAPALIAGEFALSWLYVAAPILGALAAMGCYAWLRKGRVPPAGDVLGASGPFDLDK